MINHYLRKKTCLMLRPPAHVTTYEGELATFWFDESGILCAIGKQTTRTLDMQKNNYDFIRQISGGKKVCLLSDATSSDPHDKETRDYMAREMPNVFIAMAVVADSAVGRFVFNTFIRLKRQPVPMRFFPNEKEARAWLKQYL